MKNPYQSFIEGFASLVRSGKELPLGAFPYVPARVEVAASAPKVLLFSPHPDDECIIGGLPLRLLRELKVNVINVAVTQGSSKVRQAGRLKELNDACNFLGFGVQTTVENGLEKVNRKTRDSDPVHWAKGVSRIAEILTAYRPAVIFFPHERDNNSSHIGTNLLVMDALKTLGASFGTLVIETEFWAPMETPNLMVESSVSDVADLVAAITFHVEEVRRNPYHLTMPAWMQDNVRRGGEQVGNQGGSPPSYTFATLYRLRRWEKGALTDVYSGGKMFGAGESLQPLFGQD